MQFSRNWVRHLKIFSVFIIIQNIAMESEHNTKLSHKNVQQTHGNIYYFNTSELNKSMFDSKWCAFFTVFIDKRYVEK